MDLSNLKPSEGSVFRSKRLGRGQGSGKGGTSTKGHKGAKSRSGSKRKPGFEGGQMPLQRRVPKFGFNNINRKEYKILNLSQLEYYMEEGMLTNDIKIEDLVNKRIIKRTDLVKILGEGELTKSLKIETNKISKKAMDIINKLGGSVNIVE